MSYLQSCHRFLDEPIGYISVRKAEKNCSVKLWEFHSHSRSIAADIYRFEGEL